MLKNGLKEDPATAQKGPLPPGWTGRTDTPSELLASANIRTMGNGIHVTTGPAVTLWNAENAASGNYTISATFNTLRSPTHGGLGLIWGGENMDSARATYADFLVYGNGAFAIEHRVGKAVHTLVGRTDNVHPAIHVTDANGTSSNALEVRVADDSVRFIVNGQQVHALSAESPMVPGAGISGLRVNRKINVHVANFTGK